MSTQKSEDYHSEQSDNQMSPFERIMIVENNEHDWFVHHTLIDTLGLGKKIEKRSSLSEVLKELNAAKRLSDIPNLILLSIQTGNKQGIQFLERFGDLPDFIRDKCKLIIVTTTQSKEDKQRAIMNPSVIRYLEKPIDVVHFRDFMFM